MKLIRTSLFLLIALLFFACGNHKKVDEKTAITDSLPADLVNLNKKIADDPDNARLYDQRAVYYLQAKDIEKAFSDANRAINLDPKTSSFYLTLSDVYFASGRITKCQESLNKSIELNPEDKEAYLKLAELFYYMKDYKKTFENTAKALKIDNLTAKADFINGMALKDLGDTLKAVKSFEKAVDKDQQYFHAYMQLGLMYSAKRSRLALDYFNNALNLNPKSIEALYALAYFCQENNEYNRAIEKYTMITQIDPNYKQAYYNMGYIHLVYLRVYDVAANYFTTAIKCDPNYFEAWYNRGYCYELLGNINFARTDYQQALKIKNNYQRAIDGMNRLDKISHL
jgi:tetratricopeptide (TPR) repeat protein